VQHTPHVDVLGMLDVEDQMGKARQWPGAKAWQVQFVGMPRRAGGRMTAEMTALQEFVWASFSDSEAATPSASARRCARARAQGASKLLNLRMFPQCAG
jgi:hypothetical protein